MIIRNRSSLRDQTGAWFAGSVSVDSLAKILDGVALPQVAGLHNREDAFDKTATHFARAAEAAAAPEHRSTHQALHIVVRRLHAFGLCKCPQRGLKMYQMFAELR